MDGRRPAPRRGDRSGARVHVDAGDSAGVPHRPGAEDRRDRRGGAAPRTAICAAPLGPADRGHGAAHAAPDRAARMSFLAPAAAALALTLPAIVALYFLRIRRPTRVVPALHLWPDQIRDRQANVPWQTLRFSWLLLLQLLVAAFLVTAAVEPALSASVTFAPHSIVLLDASASMQARDVQP